MGTKEYIKPMLRRGGRVRWDRLLKMLHHQAVRKNRAVYYPTDKELTCQKMQSIASDVMELRSEL